MAGSTAATIETLDAITFEQYKDDSLARLNTIAAVRRLLNRLQTPFERAWDIVFDNPVSYAAIQTCIDLGIWKAWLEDGAGEKTLEEVKQLANADIDLNLLRRLFRLLSSSDYIEEIGEDKFKPTKFSLALGERGTHMAQVVQAGTDHVIIPAANLPVFLAKTAYKETLDPKICNYLDATPEKLSFFDRMQQNGAYADSFAGMMAGWTKMKIPWPEYYDIGTHLISGADLSSAPLIVDVGGNVGLDLVHVLRRYPDLPAGALVLEDLAHVVATAEVDSKVKIVEHDFFTSQPIQHSRAYFFHAVFHDWSDEESKKILTHIAAAMKKGYSKLLIHDIVLPPTGATTRQAAMDVEMMNLLSAGERTQAQWKKLLTESGFEILKFWTDPRGAEAVIELELA
ncbi:putative O-methyltransferase [Bisporella sp. PMI_857]|nr:putative O-methyltransferase [Bisporella sp. PMI_857]